MTTTTPPADTPDDEPTTDEARPKVRPLRVVRLSTHRGRPGSGYVSPADESVDWDGDDAA